MAETNKLAVFDFDGTLIKGDSFWVFLVAIAGWPTALYALADGFIKYRVRYFKDKHDPTLPSLRTFLKAHLIQKLLGGRKANTIGPALEKVRQWCKWNEDVRRSLLNHFSQGHKVVIATGALNLYMPELLKDFPPHTLICTIATVKNGLITGDMGDNCVREGKAQMVSEFIANNGPFTDSWGYGNYPHDIPMLNLLKHQIVIS